MEKQRERARADRHRLRHRVKYRDWHARHWRELRHARQAVAKRTGRRRRREFFDVNEMNFRIERFCELLREIDDSRCRIREINRNKNAFHVRNRSYQSPDTLARVNPPPA